MMFDSAIAHGVIREKKALRKKARLTMTIPFKRFLVAPVLALSLVLAGCGASDFATTLRLVVAAGAPILSTLESQGKISHSLRVGLIADLTNEAPVVGDMAACFNAIAKGDAESKLKHLQCVQTLDQAPQTRKLLSDFGSNPTVSMIADDFSAVLEAAVLFYGGTVKNQPRAQGSAPQVITESEINARVKQLKKDLGQ